ncbi:hypothetical protein SSIG_07257 [Streptomyces filamentosus NRRL 11379]|nr:hypothetical protein SSIG_07257 [Streptomyces filamentosus NRRL 11379]
MPQASSGYKREPTAGSVTRFPPALFEASAREPRSVPPLLRWLVMPISPVHKERSHVRITVPVETEQ